jgi:hypothetical protein
MKILCKTHLIYFLALLFLVACGQVAVYPATSSAIVAETPTQSIIAPTPASEPAAISLSLTVLPPISTTNAKQVLTQFVQENGGCTLPCLLGLSPVHSDRTSVEMFSRYFQGYSQKLGDQTDGLGIDGHYNDDFGSARLIFWKNHIRVDVGIDSLVTQNNQIEYIAFSAGVYEHSGEGVNEAARILSNHPDYDELLGKFSLPAILLDYGKPDEIWIRPFPVTDDFPHTYETGLSPFDFLLIYFDQGFAVEYMTWVEVIDDGYLMGCPDVSYMKVASWNPERKVDFAEIASYFSGTHSLSISNFSEFKQIQEVTLLSVEDFYNAYKDPGYDECVKTPINLWP